MSKLLNFSCSEKIKMCSIRFKTKSLMTIIKQMKYGMLALLEYFDDIYWNIYHFSFFCLNCQIDGVGFSLDLLSVLVCQVVELHFLLVFFQLRFHHVKVNYIDLHFLETYPHSNHNLLNPKPYLNLTLTHTHTHTHPDTIHYILPHAMGWLWLRR